MKLTKALIIGCALLCFTGCAKDGKPLAKMTFDHLQPEFLYVSTYEPVDNSNFVDSNLPQGFVSNPANVIMDYLNHRFTAAGGQGRLVVALDNVSVVHQVSDSSSKVGQFLGVDRYDTYNIEAMVKITAYGLPGYESRTVQMKARRMLEVTEYLSIIEREKKQMQAIHSLIDDLDDAIVKALRNDLKIYQ